MSSNATTPMDSRPLTGLMVALSVSDVPAPDLACRGLGPQHLDHAFIELNRHLFNAGATVAYGGDHRLGGFTDQLFGLLGTYAPDHAPSRERIRNYLAYPLSRDLTDAKRAQLRPSCRLIELDIPANLASEAQRPWRKEVPADRRLLALSLTAMRERMTAELSCRVLLGGRYGGVIDGVPDLFQGRYPGVLEEEYMALQAHKPLFLAGGFGGCTERIIRVVRGDKTPEPLSLAFHTQADPVYRDMVQSHWQASDPPIAYDQIVAAFRSAGIAGLNGLTDAENQQLFETVDVDEMIALVLRGLRRIPSAGNTSASRAP